MSVGNSTIKETAGNLVMAGGKTTGAAAATATGDGVIYDQLADGTVTYPAAVGATSHSHRLAQSRSCRSFRCDFCSPNLAAFIAATSYIGEVCWDGINANSATGLTLTTGNTATEMGILSMSTGAQTNGACSAVTWGAAVTAGLAMVMTSADPFYIGFKVASPTVSDGTDTFICRVGLSDTANAAPANGAWFEWNANADTHFLTKTSTGSTPTTVQTTTVVAGTGYHVLEIRKPAGSTTITFSIDGVDLANTGTIDVTHAMGPAMLIVKSAGTNARTLLADWCDFDRAWVTPRT